MGGVQLCERAKCLEAPLRVQASKLALKREGQEEHTESFCCSHFCQTFGRHQQTERGGREERCDRSTTNKTVAVNRTKSDLLTEQKQISLRPTESTQSRNRTLAECRQTDDVKSTYLRQNRNRYADEQKPKRDWTETDVKLTCNRTST